MRKLNLQKIEQDIRDIIQDVRNEINKMGGIASSNEYNPIEEDVRHFMTTSVYPIHKYLLSGDIQRAKDFCKFLISDVGEHAADEDNLFSYGFIMVGRIHDYLSRAIEQLEVKPIDKAGAGKNESIDLPVATGEKQKKTSIKNLTVRQVALLHVYNDQPITKENAEEIARNYGHESGKHLLSRYGEYIFTADRKGKPNPFTARKLENKIELLRSIIDLLPEDKISKPIDELKKLESYRDELK